MVNFDNHNSKDWEEMAKYLSSEMNDEEKNAFEQRIRVSEYNKGYFEQIETDWEKMENFKEKDAYNTNKAWNKLFGKMEEDGLLETQKSTFHFGLLTKIAAILVVGILLTYFVHIQLSGRNTGLQVADTYENTDIKKIELADGSLVYLNANSKLYYPETFEGNTRTIEFEGDGFFEITKNPAKPFIIKAKSAEIKVLGTSFNINTKTPDNKVEVLVETGKVQLSSLKNKSNSTVLTPGIIGRLNKEDILTYEENEDVNYIAWKTRVLNFENVEFKKAIEVLNRVYNVHIVFDEKQIGNNPITGNWNNEPIETVLKIICETKQLNSLKNDNKIVLTKK